METRVTTVEEEVLKKFHVLDREAPDEIGMCWCEVLQMVLRGGPLQLQTD